MAAAQPYILRRTDHVPVVTPLPAAGAFLIPANILGVAGYRFLCFQVRYAQDPGSATGRPAFQVVWTAAAAASIDTHLFGRDLAPHLIRGAPIPGGPGAAFLYTVPVTNPGGMPEVRLEIREFGDIALPGFVTAFVTGASV